MNTENKSHSVFVAIYTDLADLGIDPQIRVFAQESAAWLWRDELAADLYANGCDVYDEVEKQDLIDACTDSKDPVVRASVFGSLFFEQTEDHAFDVHEMDVE